MSSFLDDYSEWAVECTDAPAVFHKWGGYMALSSALGRQATFRFGPFEVPLNLYVLLLAPSSIFRKTTALNLSKRIAGKVGAYDLASDGSPEGFVEDLRQHPQGTLYYSELASLLAQFNREYAAALRPLLTDLYDAPPSYRRKLRSMEITIDNPCISIFAASVLDWVMERVRQADFSGGFLTRFTIVAATSKERTMAIPPPANVQLENNLVTRLQEIRNSAKGQVQLDPIRMEYETWATKFERRAKSPLLAAFVSRLAISALKLTVLEQVAETGELALTLDAFERATASIEGVADTIQELEDSELGYGDDRDGRDLRRVVRAVSAAGELDWTALWKKTRLPKQRMKGVIDSLTDAGQVTVDFIKRPNGGRPLRVVKWIGGKQPCSQE